MYQRHTQSPYMKSRTQSAADNLQMHILGTIAEFERARIAERVKAGLQRARAQGKSLGRPGGRLEP